MDSQIVSGTLSVEVPHREQKDKRKALVEIKYGSFIFNPPPNRTKNKDGNYLQNIKMTAVYVKEISPPKEVDSSLEWMLLTNIEINSFEDAVEKINWYKKRWQIESFHKVLKSAFKVEDCRLETAERLFRYLALINIIAWRLFWLLYVNRIEPEAACTVVFDNKEWNALYCKINKTKHIPKNPPTINEVVRWIAQLGGFLARKNDAEPGMVYLWMGWLRFNDIVEDWVLFN